MAFDLTEETTKFALACSLILIVYFFMHRWLYMRHLPPGPIGIPLLGYFPFLGKRPYETLRDLSKKYGDIMSFYIGSHLAVCISDHDAAKEILKNPLTLSRRSNGSSGLCFGFASLKGKEWQQHRSFVVQTMKNLGVGGKLWESVIHEDLEELMNEIRHFKGEPKQIEEELQIRQIKHHMYILTGRKFTMEENTAEIKTIQQGRTLFPYLSPLAIPAIFPWITKFLRFAQVSSYREFLHLFRQYQNVLREETKVVMQSEQQIFARNDFVTFYLQKMKDVIQSSSHSFTMENLIGDMTVLLLGSSDASAFSVTWLLLLMAKHQNIQEKVHEEIDSVIGRNGVVHYHDRAKLPYSMATVLEMFRWVPISPLIKRCVLEEFKFNNYTIRKGSLILVNMWAIMHDPRYFSEPMEFRPERFLNETGTKIVQVKGYAPFSFGKRKCPGELEIMITVFIYFVSIVQKFKVTFPPGIEGDLDRESASLPFPKPQGLCFLER